MLKEWWNNGEVMSYFGYPSGMGIDLDGVKKELLNDPKVHYNRLIIEDGEKPIGETYFQQLDNVTAKIGIRICDFTLRNRGCGRIILSMLVSFLFNERNCKFVTVTTNFTNERARHVYEKLGFKQNSLEHKNEQTFVVYRMTKEDFVSFLE